MAKRQDWAGLVYQFDVPTDGVNYGIATHNRVWDSVGLQWVSMTQPGGSGGGGTQYAQGATVATPTGTVALGQTPSNVLRSLALDASGNLNVNLAAGSISGGNAAASPTGAAVPASAGYTGWNSGGNLVGASLTNGLPVQPATGATFPVSGSVSVSNFPASQAVTGTFWQATQPVSIATMPTTPVTGTFWQATQPVSIAAAVTVAQATAANLNATVTGSVSVSNFPASQAVTGTFWQATQPVSVASTLAVKETQPATSTRSSVAASASVVTVLASNANRRQATVYNDSTVNLYLGLGATASTTDFTLIVAGGGYYELPQPVYTGVITGVWASATGNARVTELT